MNTVNFLSVKAAKSAARKSNKTKRIVFAVVFVVFVLYALVLLYPFFYALTVALKENGRAFMREPVAITFPLYFSNFKLAFENLTLMTVKGETSFFMMLFNSLWYSIGSTLCTLIASTCVAYVVAKYNFRGRSIVYGVAIVTMMIPIYGAMPAKYRLYTQMGIIDSPLLLITAFNGFGMYFIYIHSFFKSLSWSFAEAAFIDGASNFKVFVKIMLPMLVPSLSALAIMNFITVWNDYEGPLVWLPNMPTLASGLYTYEINIQYTANHPVYFAGVILSLIPVLAIFAIFQNTIMTHVYAGGLKG